MALLVGTSGWQYRHWRGRFYPEGLAQARWLEHYAARFATVESNAAFYRLPERDTFAAWAGRTPADFVMAVKASRYLTHVRRLRDPEQPVARLLERAAGRSGRVKVNYATLEHAGEPHRGRITEAEKELVRDNLDKVNRRLREDGMREIDPSDQTMRDRYGL